MVMRKVGKMKRLLLTKKRHNRIKRRLELGMGKPGDELMLKKLKLELGYK